MLHVARQAVKCGLNSVRQCGIDVHAMVSAMSSPVFRLRPLLQDVRSQFEAAVMFIDSVVSAVCSAHLTKGASPNLDATLSSTEALLQLLLGARFADPVLLNWHARSLESFSKLLARKPELVQAVMQKVCAYADADTFHSNVKTFIACKRRLWYSHFMRLFF